jgi:putative ABC transport system permease protein
VTGIDRAQFHGCSARIFPEPRCFSSAALPGPDLLVAGELVGTATGPGHLGVDEISNPAGGRLPVSGPGVIVEQAFATNNRLPPQGDLTISGGTAVHYGGMGQSPEYFLITGGQGALPFLSQKSYGVLFSTLHAAQQLTAAPGRVNDLVLTLRPGTDRAAIHRQLQTAVDTATPALSATVTNRRDIAA